MQSFIIQGILLTTQSYGSVSWINFYLTPSIWTTSLIIPDSKLLNERDQAQDDLYVDLYRCYFRLGRNVYVLRNTQSKMSPHPLLPFLSLCLLVHVRGGKKGTKWQRLNTGSGGTFLCAVNLEAKLWNPKLSLTVGGGCYCEIWHMTSQVFGFRAKCVAIMPLWGAFYHPNYMREISLLVFTLQFLAAHSVWHWLSLHFLPNFSVCTTSPSSSTWAARSKTPW